MGRLVIFCSSRYDELWSTESDPPSTSGADLFAGLRDRCRGGRLAHVRGAAENTPSVVVAGMADQQHPSCLVDR
jgi:hypothetical protein